MDHPTLADCIAFLERPDSFPEPTASVEIIQTHISVVAMTDRHVYKLKKPVFFDFLDFSTLEKRLYFCREEIRLNQRLSPNLYVGLLPLYAQGGQLSFEPGGTLVDYVIQMHRLSEEGMLIRQINNPAFPIAALDRIAGKLLAFYQDLLRNAELTAYGDASGIRSTIGEVFEGTEQLPAQEMHRAVKPIIRDYLMGFLDRQEAVFTRRVQEKRIIEGHGDLRSEHVHISEQAITIYDCLEFDQRLRTVDWLNDVAFLLMDLDYRQRHDLAQRLEASWVAALEKEEVGTLLNFYKTYRACVRAKVNGLKAAEEEIPSQVRTESQQKARRYYQLALRYVLLGPRPTVVVCLGGVASGKSTLAAGLASWLNLSHINSDMIRKQQAGLSPYTRLNDGPRASLYTAEATGQVYEAMLHEADRQIQTRGAALLDATYRQVQYLQALSDHCHSRGYRLLVVHTEAPEELILQRLKKRETEPSVSDMRLSDYEADTFSITYPVGQVVPAVLRADTSVSFEVLLLETVIPWLRRQTHDGLDSAGTSR